MKKLVMGLCAGLVLAANVQAATHPTCKKFFKQMDDNMAKLPDEKRNELQAQWTSTKAKMTKQSLSSQAKACQNGLNSMRKMAK